MNIISKVLLGAMILLKQLFYMTSYFRASELWFYNYVYFLLNFIYRYILIRNKSVYAIVHRQVGDYEHLYSTVWTAIIIKSKVDESMMKVKLPKLLILITMLKSIYSIYYILNNKIKCICVSALFAYLMKIHLGWRSGKKIKTHFLNSKVQLLKNWLYFFFF